MIFTLAVLSFSATEVAQGHPQDQIRIEVAFNQQNITLRTTLFPFTPEEGDSFTDELFGEIIPDMPRFSLFAGDERLNGKETPVAEDSFMYDTLTFVFETRYPISSESDLMKLVLDETDAEECLVIIHFIDDTTDARLLDINRPLHFDRQGFLKSNHNSTTEHPEQPSGSSRLSWPLFGDYARHGIGHILSGYDHMLFMAALALAAVSLWDLIGVVTAFTLGKGSGDDLDRICILV